MKTTRREFIRRFLLLGIATLSAKSLISAIGCSSKPPAQVTPAAPAVPATSPAPAPAPSTDAPPKTQPASPAPSPSSSPPATAAGTPTPGTAYLSVARGKSPSALVQAAVAAVGGIERFVKPGADVIVKPNICVAYHTYEYAATTNPEVVGAVVALCRSAGARRVRVMDEPFGGTAEQAYSRSGIAEAVRNAGGQMEIMSRMKYRQTPIPDGRDMKSWQIYGDILDADVVINVPIAKHHNLSRLTLGMKNLMGVVLDRNRMHTNLGQRIADIASRIRPQLTIIDAVRILIRSGPTGGNLNDVKLTNTVIASTDIVAADAYAATLFGLTGSDIPYIRAGAEMKLGTMDLKSIQIEEILMVS